jgi:hypothetical protein
MQLEKFSKIKHEIINNLIVAKLRIKSTRPTIIQGRHFRGWGRFFSGYYFQHRLGVD